MVLSCCTQGLFFVITSYSIHYTKLYDDDQIVKQAMENIDIFLHNLKPENVTNNLNKFDFLDYIIDDDGLVIIV